MKSNVSDRIKFPQGFWAALNKFGISTHDIARAAHLPLDTIAAPVVTTAQYFAIWQAYSKLIGDTAKGIIELATGFETAKYPPSVLATYHASSYRDALYRMGSFKQLCPPEGLRIVEEGEHCTIDLNWLHGEESGPPILVGVTLAFLLELGRRGTGFPLTAQCVEFSHAIGKKETLETYFGCHIQIGHQCNRLTLRRRDLDRPFISYNEELLEILTPVVNDSLDQRNRSGSLIETVKFIMKRTFTGGRLDIQAIAKELGISNRTLQRRLTNENTSFKRLLTEARHEQARAYLSDPSFDIKEVAFLLGYKDQNSFYRAFRRWEDDTPSNWRTQRIASPPL